MLPIYECTLTINKQSKAIPYPPDIRSDGSINYGFQILKGRLEAISEIHEAKDCFAFQSILKTLNSPSSPFFSVGCEKWVENQPHVFWKKGYIEFAYNSDAILDGTNYFRLFYAFNRYISDKSPKRSVALHWDLQPAHFVDVGKVGFSCCIWIATADHKTSNECEADWNRSVVLLSEYLDSVRLKVDGLIPIYPRPGEANS